MYWRSAQITRLRLLILDVCLKEPGMKAVETVMKNTKIQKRDALVHNYTVNGENCG